jgi:hypothetical protein
MLTRASTALTWLIPLALAATSCSSGGKAGGAPPAAICVAGATPGTLQRPVFVRTLDRLGQTGWFSPPVVVDLNGDGKKEVVSASYGAAAHARDGALLDRAAGNGNRIFAPCVVADLDADGVTEIVCGQGKEVYAYEWKGGHLSLKAGWPVDTTHGGMVPEVRGLAAADLAGDGHLEVVATTTQIASTSAGGAQVFVYKADGTSYQPPGIAWPAWPRYNALPGPGGDATRNGAGHEGYGCYGLNAGIANLDGGPTQEIVVTYDNHAIQVFGHDGVALDTAPWFTTPGGTYGGQRLTWGQMIRWADPAVEEAQYHAHTGDWPLPTAQERLQWTASPPSFGDLDGDGHDEVVAVPNVELGDPYVTQAYAVMVLQGAAGDGSRSGRRLPGWETLPRGGAPMDVGGSFYPPIGIPAAAVANLTGDARPEIVVSLNDGFMYAFDAQGQRLWRYDFRADQPLVFATEPTLADLDQDGSPEVIFATYGSPTALDAGRLIILSASGTLRFDLPLPDPALNGNGVGALAAPTVADLDGDGQLEILVQTIGQGVAILRVPGSAANCLPWSQARGGARRTGKAHGT